MKDGEKQRTRRKATGARFVTVPVLLTVTTCPQCGNEVDLWTGDDETRCGACACEIYRRQRTLH